MYKINQDQINALIRAFYECNVPVKVFDGVKEIFNSLPRIEETADGKQAVNIEAEAPKE